MALPKVAANKLNRWLLVLSTNDFEIEYIVECNNGTADVLSILYGHDKISHSEKASSLLNFRLKDMPVKN